MHTRGTIILLFLSLQYPSIQCQLEKSSSDWYSIRELVKSKKLPWALFIISVAYNVKLMVDLKTGKKELKISGKPEKTKNIENQPRTSIILNTSVESGAGYINQNIGIKENKKIFELRCATTGIKSGTAVSSLINLLTKNGQSPKIFLRYITKDDKNIPSYVTRNTWYVFSDNALENYNKCYSVSEFFFSDDNQLYQVFVHPYSTDPDGSAGFYHRTGKKLPLETSITKQEIDFVEQKFI